MLGFAQSDDELINCRMGGAQRNPTSLGEFSTQPTNCQVAQVRTKPKISNAEYSIVSSQLSTSVYSLPSAAICINSTSNRSFTLDSSPITEPSGNWMPTKSLVSASPKRP